MLLALQDEFGADVNIALFGLWRAKQGRSLSPSEFAALDILVAEWRENVVQPARRLRRAIKNSQDGSAAVSELYGSVKHVQLNSERIEQARMFAANEVAAGSCDHELKQAATLNLEAYGRMLGKVFPLDIVSGLASALHTMLDREG